MSFFVTNTVGKSSTLLCRLQCHVSHDINKCRSPYGWTKARSKLLLSTDAVVGTQSSVVLEETAGLGALSSSSTTQSELVLVPRHGPGDQLIKLNVGGKEFQTLRSTLQTSPVLAEYCRRALENNEFADSTNDTIFIDRDPTHFALILTFLRNKTEGIAYNSKQSKISSKLSRIAGSITSSAPSSSSATTTNGVAAVAATASSETQASTTASTTNTTPSMAQTITKMTLAKHPQYLRLPKIDEKNEGLLEDLFVEAQHYQLEELQFQLCQSSMWVTFMSYVNGGRNPFQSLDQMVTQVRRWGLALAGTGSIYGFLQAELTWMESLLPPMLKPNNSKGENGTNSGGDTSSTSSSPEPSFAG